ncbi:LON peptidase substrate-binding domain-containing protein, partial [Patescibacteria group bacterium]|nr:LON peptidase substrate-binding domain-containing protein [Patescibacteria group bacterium]
MDEDKIVPLIPVRGVVVFPHTEIALTFGRPRSVAAVEAASKTDKLLCLVSQKDPRITKPNKDDLYRVGTLVKVVRMLPSEEVINALVRGINRVEIEKMVSTDSFFEAKVKSLPEIVENDDETKALVQFLKKNFRKAVGMGKTADLMAVMNLMGEGGRPEEVVDQAASVLDLEVKDKQKILETISVKKRLQQVSEYLANEMKILNLEKRIASKTQNKFEKNVREAMLRERKKVIEKELGELDEEGQEIKELRAKIKAAKMPIKVVEKAKKELKRLGRLNPQHPERGYIRTYLEVMTDLPWSKSSPNKMTIGRAVKVLDEDHHGLKNVKERIIEYLAVMKLREAVQKKKSFKNGGPESEELVGPTILCFVGPPGVGKTSIGKSIAKALGRKFIRMSLGGIRDEAEIRGHRRTYVGAMPGRILQGIKNSGTNNPVFMLDEIDKVGSDFRGDPSSALLEALDPEQNSEFSDHYLEVAFNLSKVMFITTANVLHTIPPALRDRMEVINFPGYTEEEKFKIARKYLWSKQLNINGL